MALRSAPLCRRAWTATPRGAADTLRAAHYLRRGISRAGHGAVSRGNLCAYYAACHSPDAVVARRRFGLPSPAPDIIGCVGAAVTACWRRY